MRNPFNTSLVSMEGVLARKNDTFKYQTNTKICFTSSLTTA